MTKHQAKEITQDEARHLFLKHIASLVEYWEKESRASTSKDKLEGLAFSIMVTLDGGSGGHPGYQLIPNTNPEDIDFAKKEGFDYYPEEPEDIIGNSSLHNSINQYLENRAPEFKNLYDFGNYLADQAKKFHQNGL